MPEYIRDCRRCSKLGLSKGCIGKQWYNYGEIRFCRFQMIWLLIPDNLIALGEGNWPDNPDGSSYVDLPLTSRHPKDEAYFTKPIELVAETMKRLGKTKADGQTLMEEIHSGLREYYLLSRVAKSALNYISGWRRRRQSYSAWKKQRAFRAKLNTNPFVRPYASIK